MMIFQLSLHFEKSLSLKVQHHDYFFENEDDVWCVGWQNGGVQSSDGKNRILLGGCVLLDPNFGILVGPMFNQKEMGTYDARIRDTDTTRTQIRDTT
ncbi:aspartic proteinase-like protein 2 [Asparagus officinalis]|uniref:aspartic proteinase-like protein 2 n=1 Tax=Asparagus officinalis TaxID=4686 RepID=UPI00098E460C|nr:aspartic proteinase-like protein 2 [Asparagus officinalis]